MVWPDDISRCHAVPLNQPEKKNYDRSIEPQNICLRVDEWLLIQKNFQDQKNKCDSGEL